MRALQLLRSFHLIFRLSSTCRVYKAPYPYVTSTRLTDGGEIRLINVLTWPKIWFNYASRCTFIFVS